MNNTTMWSMVIYSIVQATMALHSIIDCEPLKIFRVYEGRCFRHVMFKAY
jgi:hypothetical protein